MVTVLIVPAWSDQAGQCRIVAADGKYSSALTAYRQAPENWKEVGTMNSRGDLIALTACRAVREELKACEPLAAGYQWHFDSL